MKIKILSLLLLSVSLFSCEKDDPPIKLQSITLDKTEIELKPAGTLTISANLTPANAVNAALVWVSSDTSIVTVSRSGDLLAKNVGVATITVKNIDGTVSAVSKVDVTPIGITNFTLNKTLSTLKLGETDQLTVTITPTNATYQKYVFQSSDDKVVNVDQTGKITALTLGKARITVKTEDGKFEAFCDVTVNPIEVESLTLNKTSATLIVGGTDQLTITVLPINATNKKIIFQTSDAKIVAVDQNGKLTATGVGKARITVKTEDGKKEVYCDVTVNPLKVSGINLKQGTQLTIYKGFTSQLSFDITPLNATNQKVAWSSSNSNIISVSSTGLITANTLGTANISVTTEDGSFKSTILVTVKDPTTAFSTRITSGLIVSTYVTYTMNVYFTNSGPTDVQIEKVAILDGSGKVLIENSDPTKLVTSVKANAANVLLSTFTSSTGFQQSWKSVVTYKLSGKRYTITTGGGIDSVIALLP